MTTAICNTVLLDRTSSDGPGRWRAVDGIDIVLDGDIIAGLGTNAAADFPGARTIDGRRLLLTPGLVNAHCHSAETLARGRASSAGLNEWLTTLADIEVLSGPDIALSISLCAAEQLRSGVTSVTDHFRQVPASLAAAEIAARSWEATGLRATVAMMVSNMPAGATASETGVCPPDAELIALSTNWLDAFGDTPRVIRALGPASPDRCTEPFLAALTELAMNRRAPLHAHLDGTAEQAARTRQQFEGRSGATVLSDIGALGPATSLVHCVHIDEEDAERIAASGATAVHCPVANLRLGSGVAPISRLRDLGARLALATDGAASNDAQSITEVVKSALLLSRLGSEPRSWLTTDDVLDMAFRPGPRRFLGEEDPFAGRLQPGAPADIAAFDLDDPLLVPANDLAAQFALSGGSLRARHVWVRGNRLLKDGVPVDLDPAALADAARARSHTQRAA